MYRKQTHQHMLGAFLTLLSVYAIVLASAQSPLTGEAYSASMWSAFHQRNTFQSAQQSWHTLSMSERVAHRLQKRLAVTMGAAPHSVSSLAAAVEKRQELLKHAVDITFLRPDGSEHVQHKFTPQADPLLLLPQFSGAHPMFSIDEKRITETIEQHILPDVARAIDITLTSVIPDGDVLRVQTTDVAKAGWELDLHGAAGTVKESLESGATSAVIPFNQRNGNITNASGQDLGALKLLASGRSNFKGSPAARISNVQKALRDHVHNTLIAPGAAFSFNSTLGGPVTQGRGWHMAKIIVNSNQLEYAPGGGICQASTTVYRAAIQAGFPVLERRSHSLYVSYYKEYGVGIDATIFPGSQDLVFVNDTPQYVLFQAYDDGYDAVVNVYGTDDGRAVDLQGPFFSTNAPPDLRIDGREIKTNEIVWVQYVTYPDGRKEQHVIVSRYQAIPRSLKQEYALGNL